MATRQFAAIAFNSMNSQLKDQKDWDFVDVLMHVIEEAQLLDKEIMIFSRARLLTTIFSILNSSIQDVERLIDSQYPKIVQKNSSCAQLDVVGDAERYTDLSF